MNNRTDIKLGTDLGILYNKAQENNIKAEILRCKEIEMPKEIIKVFEKPARVEVSVKMAHNSSGYCYGIDYLFSDESIRCIREIYENKYDISNLVRIKRHEYEDYNTISNAVFDEESIKEIWTFMDEGYDPELFMELEKYEDGRDKDFPKFFADQISEISLAIRHKLDYNILLEESEIYGKYKSVKHHAGTMRLINQAMSLNLPSLPLLTMPNSKGFYYAFEPISHGELNYIAMNVPQIFEVVTKLNSENNPVYSYQHIYYIARAYEYDIPSKEKFIELNENGEPKHEWFELEKIIKDEYKN